MSWPQPKGPQLKEGLKSQKGRLGGCHKPVLEQTQEEASSTLKVSLWQKRQPGCPGSPEIKPTGKDCLILNSISWETQTESWFCPGEGYLQNGPRPRCLGEVHSHTDQQRMENEQGRVKASQFPYPEITPKGQLSSLLVFEIWRRVRTFILSTCASSLLGHYEVAALLIHTENRLKITRR